MPVLSQQYTVSFEAGNGDTLDTTVRASSEVDAEERVQELTEQVQGEDPAMQWRLVRYYRTPHPPMTSRQCVKLIMSQAHKEECARLTAS